MCLAWVGWGGEYRKMALRTFVSRLVMALAWGLLSLTGCSVVGAEGKYTGFEGRIPATRELKCKQGQWGRHPSAHIDKVRGDGWGRGKNRQESPPSLPLDVPWISASLGSRLPLSSCAKTPEMLPTLAMLGCTQSWWKTWLTPAQRGRRRQKSIGPFSSTPCD